jgi:hypothetical protein
MIYLLAILLGPWANGQPFSAAFARALYPGAAFPLLFLVPC